jgi:hypothetical protein
MKIVFDNCLFVFFNTLYDMLRLHGGGRFGKPEPTDLLFGTLACLAVLAVFDFLVANRALAKARWFALHAVANAGVVIFGLGDVLRAFADPFEAAKGEYQLIPFYFITSVHLYHMIGPGFQLKVADWVHHLVFAGAICTIAITDQWGNLFVSNIFYIYTKPKNCFVVDCICLLCCPGPVQNVVGFFLSG